MSEWRFTDSPLNFEVMFEGEWHSWQTHWSQPDGGKNARFKETKRSLVAYLNNLEQYKALADAYVDASVALDLTGSAVVKDRNNPALQQADAEAVLRCNEVWSALKAARFDALKAQEAG